MNDRLVKIGEAAKILGVNPQTLRRWEQGGVIQPFKRTPKGTRLYSLQELLGAKDLSYPTIAYARVSSSDQKEDLERQQAVLEAFCNKKGWQTEIIKDLGSGINSNKNNGFIQFRRCLRSSSKLAGRHQDPVFAKTRVATV